MCSMKSSGNRTLSCNVGSTTAPPEWPWIARRHRKCSGELGFKQYWNLFLGPPPHCKKLIHVRIGQCEVDSFLDRTTGCFVRIGALGFRKGPTRWNRKSYPVRHCFHQTGGHPSSSVLFAMNGPRRDHLQHSFCLIMLFTSSYPERNFAGNKLPDGSLSLSLPHPSFKNDLPVDIETSLRQSFPWLLPCSSIIHFLSSVSHVCSC